MPTEIRQLPTILFNLALAVVWSVSAQAADDVPQFDVPRLHGIAIDGDGADWLDQGLSVEVMASAGGNTLPAEQFDPAFRLGWDERGLLLLVSVCDDTVGQGGDPEKLWESDSIELFVAPATGTGYYQLIVKPRLDSTRPMQQAFYDFRRTHTATELTAVTAGVGAAAGYAIEVLLPWANLQDTPRPGDELKMQILVNDYDASGRLQARWFPDEPREHSAKGMHRIRLAEAAGPPVQAVVTASFPRPDEVELSAVAVAELVGQPLEVRVRGRAVARGVFAEAAGRASAGLTIPQDKLGEGDRVASVVCRGRQVGRVVLANPYRYPSPWDPPTPCVSAPRRWTLDGLEQDGEWRYGANDDGLILSNALVGVVFTPAARGGGLTSLYHFATETEFVSVPAESPRLWELQVRREDGAIATVSNAAQRDVQFEPRAEDGDLNATLTWPAVRVPGVQGDLTVRVHVAMRAGDAAVRLRIEVDNRLEGASLWRVDFPSVLGLGYAGASDLARPRENHGFLYRRMDQSRHGVHPSGTWPMQFLSLSCGKSALYLACEDPQASHKGFEIAAGEHFRIYTPPPGMTVPGTDYCQAYDSVLEPMAGDWYDVARRYRQWALQQPWMRQGSIAERTDIPEAFKRISLWILASGNGDEFIPGVLEAQERLDVPMGVHWYNWHEIDFDHEYPHFFPVKPGFIDNVPRLTERGIYAMPYINGRLWDSRLNSFTEASAFACKDVDGEPYLERYGSSPPLSPMCPATGFWQQVLVDLVSRLRRECGVNAIYIDQIGGMEPVLCFDKSHGHTLGGGDWWAQGYREMLAKIRAAAGPDIALTTENNGETFGDYFGMLIWTPRRPDMAPLYSAVYGDRIIRFGSRLAADMDDTTFAINFGRDLLWGGQLGWTDTWFMGESNTAGLFRRLVQLRGGELLPFLAFGDMVRPPSFREPVPRTNCAWDTWMSPTMPTIDCAAWRAPDGRVAAVFVNSVHEPYVGDIDLSELTEPGHRYRVVRLTLGERQAIGTVTQADPVLRVTFPAYDGMALILEEEQF